MSARSTDGGTVYATGVAADAERAERILLGAILGGQHEVLTAIGAQLTPEDFGPRHARIVRALIAAGDGPVLTKIPQDLLAYVAGLTDGIPTLPAHHVADYIEQVAAGARRRRVSTVAAKIAASSMNGASDADVDALLRDLQDAGTTAHPPGTRPLPELDIVSTVTDESPIVPVAYVLKDPARDAGLYVNGEVVIESGDGKIGKSVKALALALSFTTGAPLGGVLVPVGAPKRVLYLDSENPEPLIRYRFPRLVRGLGVEQIVRAWGDNRPLRYVWTSSINLDTQQGFDAVRRLVDEHRPDWIIFDSLIRFTRRLLTSAEDMSALYLDRWRPLRDMVSGGLIIQAHLRKRSALSSNDPGQRLYGSVDLRNSADAHIAMERDGDSLRVTHEATRWDELFPPFLLRLEWAEDRSSAKLIYEGEADDAHGSVRTWLREAGESGLLRQDVVKKLVDAKLAKDAEAADRMATRALAKLRNRKETADERQGNAKRYWLKDSAPRRLLDEN